MSLTSSVGWWPARCVSPVAPPPICATSATLSVTREDSPAAPQEPVQTTSPRTQLLMETSAPASIQAEEAEVRATILAVRMVTADPGQEATTAGTAATDITPATL